MKGGHRPRDRLRVGANLVLAIAQIAATQVHLLGLGQSIGARSQQSPALSTPPGWAFGIWSLIYLGLIAYAVWQALPAQRHEPALRRVGWWTAAAMLLGGAWAIVTQWQGVTGLTVAVIAAMLACLLQALLRLPGPGQGPRLAGVFLRFPIGLFAGWITAAALVNLAAWLQNAQGLGGSQAQAEVAAAMLALAAALGAGWVGWKAQAPPAYPLGVAWALAALFVKTADAGAWMAAGCAGAGVLVLVLLAVAVPRPRPGRG